MFSKKTHILIAVTVPVVWAGLFRLRHDSLDVPKTVSHSVSETVVAETVRPSSEISGKSEKMPEIHAEHSQPAKHKEPKHSKESELSEISVEEATDSIMPLIPGWLLESGDVRRERVQVAGQWVDRVRSRYAWPNGSLVEVEVTDIDPADGAELFKSLGFDFDLQPETTNGNLRVVFDGDDYVANLEYSEEDGSGHVQYIVAGRYMMEVRLERLLLESFHTLENRDALLATLLQYVSEQAE